MKCTNCGENNACYHYKYNINGKITEAHLCPDCARKMEGNGELKELNDAFAGFDNMFTGLDRMMDNIWGGSFFGRGLSPFASFAFPSVTVPRICVGIPADRTEEKADTKTRNPAVDPELSKKREINALREEMKAAAEKEDYEKAAEIRDKIKKLEE